MIRIEDIVEKVAFNHAQADLDLLRRAYLFSAREHKGQKRASGESYLVHPLEVANILADMKLDEVSVATGLLHDVVEDTLVDLDTIRQYFGEEITHLVDGLTKIAQISNISREEQQAENVRKMLLAMIDDVRVVLVKLADRLHNMRTLHYLNPEKRKRIAEETMEIFAPIAHRLGMGKLRGELEDLAFRHLHPEDYRELAEQLEKRRPENEAFLKAVTARIEEKMNEAEVPFVIVEGRVKRLYSIWKKLKSQKISLDQVYDLVAARIITPNEVRHCYAALGVVHNNWKPVPGRKKKQPFYVRLRDGVLFGFAGLWTPADPRTGVPPTCAIITTTANDLLAPIHDRMPVILTPEDEARWLDPSVTNPASVLSCLRPLPADRMDAYPVSSLVSSPDNEGAQLVEPVTA